MICFSSLTNTLIFKNIHKKMKCLPTRMLIYDKISFGNLLQILLISFLLFFTSRIFAEKMNSPASPKAETTNYPTCCKWSGWVRSACERLHQIWYEGDLDLYLTGYAWHNRFTYPSSKIAIYNEMAWGGGLGRGFYDEKGNWHGLIAIGFLDSHKNLQPAAGYTYLYMSHLNQDIHIGGGLAALLTMRPDIAHNIPFPGVLPLLSINYKRTAIFLTYIPGSGRVGNVLFIFGKLTLY